MPVAVPPAILLDRQAACCSFHADRANDKAFRVVIALLDRDRRRRRKHRAVLLGSILVNEKLIAVAPLALAVTVYPAPWIVLAVSVPLVAVLPTIVAGLPAMLALAPLAGGVNVTRPPLTGSLLAELTVTLRGKAKAEPGAAPWLLPPAMASVNPRDSNAPMSTALSTLRLKPAPRWSVVRLKPRLSLAQVLVSTQLLPALMAGLPGSSAYVCVTPP